MNFHFVLLVSALCLIGGAISGVAAATTAVTKANPLEPVAANPVEASAEEENDELETQAQTHHGYRQQQQQRPVYDYSQSEEEQDQEPPRQLYQSRNSKQQSNYIRPNKKQSSEEEAEEEQEEEEPDRLSLLLAKSSFNCDSKTTGYYADESLNCEVFHYCQDSQRHSWICPEGFTFHQIHLICMPPSNENICQQSSKYHIVNDYLYKPINLQEHQSKPNVTLRYSDRYYPENYYDNTRYEDDEEEAPRQRVHHQRLPVQVGFHSQPQQQQHDQQQIQYQQQTRQPQVQTVRHQPIQQQSTPVYRKPLPTTTAQPQQPQLQQQLRPQTIAPAVTATPYRFFTAPSAAPQLQQQVYRTPEEINISLQQRRPQLFVATSTPRYFDDEYLYERK